MAQTIAASARSRARAVQRRNDDLVESMRTLRLYVARQLGVEPRDADGAMGELNRRSSSGEADQEIATLLADYIAAVRQVREGA